MTGGRGIVVVGASTGAPRTHHVYLQAMPRGFAAPIVIIQHMPHGPFIEGLLRYLRDKVSAPASLASDGARLRAGEIIVAEPGTQVRIDRSGAGVRVRPAEGENFFAPSMDVTFASAAEAYGPRCMAVMLAGLHAHHDGLIGCQTVRAHGGRVLVTDRATTSCYHMIEHIRRAQAANAEAALPDVLKVIARWLER